MTEAAAALIKEGKVPTKEVPDDETPFYYMFDSHRDDNMQTLPWNPYASRAMTHRPGRRGPMPGTLPKKRPRKDPDDEPTVEYTPRLSSARRRAKRVGKVSELPAVGAIGEDAALLYDVVATAELDAARTPPSTDDDADALALMALSRS